MKRVYAAIVLLFAVVNNSYAHEYELITVSMRMERSRRIVIGVLSSDSGESSITVKEVLKGPQKPAAIRTKLKPSGEGRPTVLYFESDAPRVTYLTYVTEGSHMWNMVHMAVDPAPQTDTAKYSEHKDTVEILGCLFDSFAATSQQIPEVEHLQPRRHWERFPWLVKGLLKLRCSHDSAGGPWLKVLEIGPLVDYPREIRQHVEHVDMGYKWPRRQLPKSFVVRIDSRPPETVGSLSARQAAGYLRARLESDDPEIVLAAIAALARMHDVEAVSPIISLLDAKNEDIAVASARFLGWSRSSQAVEPLCKVLTANAASYPTNHRLSDASSRALRWIGDDRAVPSLEAAATHRVECAYEALITLGRQNSFEAVLQSEEDGLPTMAGVCLYWLIRRSNLPLEKWMQMPSTRLSAERAATWRSWWRENRKAFVLVRDSDEAFAIWRKERESNKSMNHDK